MMEDGGDRFSCKWDGKRNVYLKYKPAGGDTMANTEEIKPKCGKYGCKVCCPTALSVPRCLAILPATGAMRSLLRLAARRGRVSLCCFHAFATCCAAVLRIIAVLNCGALICSAQVGDGCFWGGMHVNDCVELIKPTNSRLFPISDAVKRNMRILDVKRAWVYDYKLARTYEATFNTQVTSIDSATKDVV